MFLVIQTCIIQISLYKYKGKNVSSQPMKLAWYIARRVATAGQQSFSRFILRNAIIAVALSVSVMIGASALIAGFKREISAKVFGFWGHIHITDPNQSRSLTEPFPIDKNQEFYAMLPSMKSLSYSAGLVGLEPEDMQLKTNGGIRHVQVYAVKPGIIKSKEEIEGILLKGIDRDFDWSFLAKYLVSGSIIELPADGMSKDVLISQATADRLRVATGDKFDVHFVEGGQQLRRRFVVSGIYKTGLEEYDRKFALVDIRQIQQLMRWDSNQVSGFEVFIDDIRDLNPWAAHIYFEMLPTHLYAETIRQKLPEIFEWLDLLDVNEVVILSLMIIVAVINMITALLILILERTNMIGTLKALGAANWSIRWVFLYYAGYILLLGLFFGNLAGLGFCWLQQEYSLIRLDETKYYLSVAPVFIDWQWILLLNIGTLLITMLFLIAPSYLISRIDPVKAIRFA